MLLNHITTRKTVDFPYSEDSIISVLDLSNDVNLILLIEILILAAGAENSLVDIEQKKLISIYAIAPQKNTLHKPNI